MRLTEKEKSVLRQLAAGAWIYAACGNLYIANSNDKLNRRTYKSLCDKGLVSGTSITSAGKKELKEADKDSK